MDRKGEKEKTALDCAHAPGYAVRVVEYPRDLRQPVHTHDRASVTLVLRGAIEETRGRQTDYAQPFSVIIKAAGIPHSDRYGPSGCKTLQISLPCEFEFGEFHLPNDRVTWFNDGGLTLRSLTRLLKCIERSSNLDSSDMAFTLYEVLAALSERHTPTGEVPDWLAQVKELIDSSPPLTSWSLKDIQKQSGFHPVHITRQFRRHFGCTIREYLKYRRVRAAASLVTESSLSLTEVAHQFAYADQAHFCRAFRSVANLSAGDYRRLVRAVEPQKVEIVQSFGRRHLQS
jgi:AraC family transcriptional regulator